jgi:hypothetical protein
LINFAEKSSNAYLHRVKKHLPISLAKVVGVPYTFLIEGLCCIVGGLIFFSKLPQISQTIRRNRP